MKKLFVIVILMTLILTSCNRNAQEPKTSGEEISYDSIFQSGDMKSIADKIESGIDESALEVKLPEREGIVLDDSNVKYHLGLNSVEQISSGVVSEPVSSAYPYSLCVIKIKDMEKLTEIKEEIKANIDLAKWICVRADCVYINNCNDIIIIVVGLEEQAEAAYNSFLKLANGNEGELYSKEIGE